MVQKISSKFSSLCQRTHVLASTWVTAHSREVSLVTGLIILGVGLEFTAIAADTGTDPAAALEAKKKVNDAICKLYALTDNGFGALLMTVAGIGAIVSSAVGGYRAATSMLVTGIGSYILKSVVSLFFPDVKCDGSISGPDTSGITGGVN